MAIHFECPHCTFPFAVADEAKGTTFNCTSCDGLVIVPTPPPTLPPLELVQRGRNVLAERHFFLFEILGIFTDWSPEPTMSDALRFLTSFLYPTAWVLVVLGVVGDYTAPGRADVDAPRWLGTAMLAAAFAYALAVKRGEVTDDWPAERGAVRQISTYLFNPAVLVMSEARPALPVYRLLALSGALLVASFLVARHAGGAYRMLPAVMRGSHVSSQSTTAPDAGDEVAPYVPYSPPAVWPPPEPVSTAPARVGPPPHTFYNPEDGPPPPP